MGRYCFCFIEAYLFYLPFFQNGLFLFCFFHPNQFYSGIFIILQVLFSKNQITVNNITA